MSNLDVFEGAPNQSAKVGLLIASCLTGLNLVVTLRFWVSQLWFLFSPPMPAYPVDVTGMLCWVFGIILTPISLRAVIGTRGLTKSTRRILMTLNIVLFGSLWIVIMRHYI